VKEYVPVAVGVPLIIPVLEAKVKPEGRLPVVTDHVYGLTPPETAKVTEYDVPITASTSVVVVIEIGALTVIVSVFVAVFCAQTTGDKTRPNKTNITNFFISSPYLLNNLL
jgi:hypothetical protein